MSRFSTIYRLAVGLLSLAPLASAWAQTSSNPVSVTTYAGQVGVRGADDGTTAARFFNPAGLAIDASGNLFVADSSNFVIRKITPAGVVSTYAGLALNPDTHLKLPPGSADGTGSAAQFNFGVPYSKGGADFAAPDPNIGVEPFIGSTCMAIDGSGNLYVADTNNNTIRKISAGGVVTTLAGQVNNLGSNDGVGTGARFSSPTATAVDAAGNVYVADSGNNLIRKISAGGSVTTLAGKAGVSGSTDGSGATATFSNPTGVAVDASGNVYVADTNNKTIRLISPAGVVSTLAGTAGKAGSADGYGTSARFIAPIGIAVDAAGNVYVTDAGPTDAPNKKVPSNIIRKISPSGTVSTIAGVSLLKGSDNGTGTVARFYQPNGITVDSSGNLYIADSTNQVIRKAVPTTTTAPAIQVTLQPVGRTNLFFGQTATLTVAANAGNFPVSIQWQKDGVNIQGANGPTLVLPAVQGSTTGAYTAVFTSGFTSFTSHVAQVDVAVGGGSLPTPVLIVLQPVGRTVTAGQPLTLSVSAVGQNTPPSYQWQKGGVDIPGATVADFTIPVTSTGDAGDYQVLAFNVDGSELSNVVSVVVNPGVATPVQIGAQPQSLTVTAGQSASFSVGATGNPLPIYQWRKNGTDISGANAATYVIPVAQLSDSGSYQVVVSNSANSLISNPAVLTVTAANSGPTIITQPVPVAVAAGGTATFTVVAGGAPAPNYQWQKNGNNIAGATNASFSIPSAQLSDAASYRVVVTNVVSSITSDSVALDVTIPLNTASRLINISVATNLAPGEGAFSMGTVVGGNGTSGTKALLARAAGPSLVPFGVTTPLPDPKMTLVRAGGVAVASNDNWGGDPVLSNIFAQVGAFAYVSPTSKDAAVYQSALTGSDFAVQVSDAGTGTGQVIAEIYDATKPSEFLVTTPRLLNVSVLKSMGNGLAAGFVISGNGNKRVLIRAIGPSLTSVGVAAASVVQDPKLVLIDAASRVVDSNDNWGGTAALSAAFAQVGAFDLSNPNSKDAALIATLAPGNYSVSVSATGSTAGLVLVEVYDMGNP